MYLIDYLIDTLQCLESFCHQKISELFMYRLHFVSDLKYPLLVRIRRMIVSRSTVIINIKISLYKIKFCINYC